MIPPVADLGGLEGAVLQKSGIPARTTIGYGWFGQEGFGVRGLDRPCAMLFDSTW